MLPLLLDEALWTKQRAKSTSTWEGAHHPTGGKQKALARRLDSFIKDTQTYIAMKLVAAPSAAAAAAAAAVAAVAISATATPISAGAVRAAPAANDLSDYAPTPFGHVLRHCIHEVPSGSETSEEVGFGLAVASGTVSETSNSLIVLCLAPPPERRPHARDQARRFGPPHSKVRDTGARAADS